MGICRVRVERLFVFGRGIMNKMKRELLANSWNSWNFGNLLCSFSRILTEIWIHGEMMNINYIY